MARRSTYTEDLEYDLFAWLDDIDAEFSKGDTQEIDGIVTIIEEQLPKFVQHWTVQELCSAIRRR